MCGRTIEIEKVRADWVLPAKAQPSDLSAPQGLPQHNFR